MKKCIRKKIALIPKMIQKSAFDCAIIPEFQSAKIAPISNRGLFLRRLRLIETMGAGFAKSRFLNHFLYIAASLAITSMTPIDAVENTNEFQPMIAKNFLEEAKKNTNWKTAFVTGKHEQIVFMNVSYLTNPNNEIGLEVHSFDQVILIVEGKGNAILNGKTSTVKEGDMIFIPQGISHNVVNLDKKKELKLISFYSETDIPKNAVYKKKSDQPAD